MKKEKKAERDFRKELDSYVREGIPLWLNGLPSSPKKIVKAHRLADESTYMRDYVRDENGRLTRLEFGEVKEK